MPVTNKVLDSLVVKLAEGLKKPDRKWTDIVKELRNHPTYGAEKFWVGNKRFRVNELARRLAEIDFLQTLDAICNAHPEFQQDPILDKAEKGPYKFSYGYGGLRVYEAGYQLIAVEKVLLVDSLPVVMRMKLAPRNGGGQRRLYIPPENRPKSKRHKKKQMVGAKTTNYAFSQENMDLFLTPFKSYFEEKDVGYVLIVYGEHKTDESDLQRDFQSMGGKIVPFYGNRESYLAFVEYICKQHNILCREAPEKEAKRLDF